MVAVDVVSSLAVVPAQPPCKEQIIAVDYLMEGKKCMLVKDYPSAASSFSQACHYLSAKHGETADECADAYFHYGKTLLELGRMESVVLGNALKGVPDCEDEESSDIASPETMTEDEIEEVGEKVMEALEENFETHEEKINELFSGHTKLDCVEEDEEDTEESQDEAMEMENSPEEENDSEEDLSNLQRAWEMLELAKNIYSRLAGTPTAGTASNFRAENIKKLCDTLLALGEVSIENENYSQAIEDLTSCLEKRKDKLPNETREIAEIQYQLGVALSYHYQFDEAIVYFNDSLKTLTSMLSTTVSGLDEHELEMLLPQIREKIQDTIDTKEKASKAKIIEGDESDSGFSCSDKPVSCIETKKN